MRDIIKKLEELNVEKEQLDEGHMSDMAHEAEKDHEVQMARSDLYKAAKYAVSIHKMMKDVSEMEGIDGWVASKITKASDYLGSVKHYMEGQMMQDVELAVVPVAGDMTDAMDVPQESIEEVHESIEVNEASKEELIDATIEQIKKDLARGDVTALEMMLMALDPRDLEAFASELDFDYGLDDDDMMDDVEVVEGRLGFKDIAKFGNEIAMRIDIAARQRGSADMEPGDADELRYRIAKEMGLDMSIVEQEVEVEEEKEDIIGDIIASLSKTKERMPMPTSKPKMSMVTKQKAMNKMALPKSKPDISMAQDTTRPLTMSKFSEWSKK